MLSGKPCCCTISTALQDRKRLPPRSTCVTYFARFRGMPVNASCYVCCRMYAFDVHCNSYFPLFILLYGEFQQFLPLMLLQVEKVDYTMR